MPHRRKTPLDLTPIEKSYLDNIRRRRPRGSTAGWTVVATLVLGFIVVGFFASLFDGPETDGIRPHGISESEFKRNSTVGKIKIEKCGDYYKYYDPEFMRQVGFGRKNPYGHTFSTTPPYASVDYIVESITVLKRGLDPTGKVVSTNRRIPRDKVIPVEYTLGNYITVRNEKIHCNNFYYSPPSTASEYERRLR